jgi:D-alanine-D-alanine ligase
MRRKLALLTGGYSGEAAVSYESVKTVAAHIDSTKYEVYTIDIRPDGWYFNAQDGHVYTINLNDFSLLMPGGKVVFDVVFMCIHGTPGEDGKLQGYFDMLNIPYTTCSAAVSAITFNKRYTVALASFSGIQVSKSVHLFKDQNVELNAVLEKLSLPVFVKPNNGGSSIGMSKVHEAAGLKAAVDKAFAEDDQVLVEEFINGREFTIGVYKQNGVVKTLPITEVISKNDFFDYEAKYLGKSEEVTPAAISDLIAEQIRQTAISVYNIFHCNGVVRIDFIYNESIGKPFMLEVNTVPGQSAASLIPQQVAAAGIGLTDFYSTLIEEALLTLSKA